MEEIELTGESKDIVSENISKLKELFPNIFTEGKVDFDKLKSDYEKITESKKSLEELYKNQIKRKDIQNQIQTFEKSLTGNKKIQYSIYDCYKNEKECTILK